MTEKDLLDAGFTVKELKILNQNIQAVKGATYESLLRDLSKRFWGGIIVFGLSLTPLVSSLFHMSTPGFLSDLYIRIGIMLFMCVVAYFITPMKLAIKARRYLKNTN